jgi:hypothetical protein
MGKAEDLGDDLLAHPLTAEEEAAWRRPVGKLGLRPEVPRLEAMDHPMQEIIDRLNDNPDILALVSEGEAVGVVIPAKWYLDFVQKLINSDPNLNIPPGLRDVALPLGVQEIQAQGD